MLDSQLSEEQKSCCGTILSAADTLLSVINNVLDFSRLEARGVTLENKTINLLKCVEEAADVVAIKAAEKGIDFSTHLEYHPNISRIIADKFRLSQIILNLTNNGTTSVCQTHAL
jgi:signal transduction histidine kinase